MTGHCPMTGRYFQPCESNSKGTKCTLVGHVQLGYTLKNMKLTIYFSKKEEECRSENRFKALSECNKV